MNATEAGRQQDMGLATGVGKSLGSPLPLGSAAEGLYAEIVETEPELAGRDFSSVYKYLKSRSGKQ